MISNNIVDIKERIKSAALKAGRDISEIVIIAACKNRNTEQIKEVIDSGIVNIGENRVQEALLKYNQLLTIDHRPSTVRWHMIGHLQTNKVKQAVEIFDLIQTVDSFELAKEIDKRANQINKIQRILIEVKTSSEATKTGILPGETENLVQQVLNLPNLKLEGLMTVAPLVDDPEKTRPYFRKLRELKINIDRLPATGDRLTILSMGMSDDFEIAIEEGSTMIRLGRAIFEGVK